MGRLFFVVLALGLLAGAVILRLFFLQVSHADEYRMVAERQHAISFLSQPSRGNIYFEDKENMLVPAAVMRRTYQLEGNPSMILDIYSAYNKLSTIVSLDKSQFIKQSSATNSTYTVFMDDINHEQATELAEKSIPGIWLRQQENRLYPQGSIASHILGFWGYVDEERIGRYGIEEQYNNLLKGTRGSYVGARSAEGFILSFASSLFTRKEDGADIVLTIDPHIQSVSHRLITESMEEWGASSAGIIVMQPQTGAILAMESMPTYDPNSYGDVDDYSLFLNPFTQKIYEMGSIVKPLTLVAGLDAQAITEETTYYDTGTIIIGDTTIGNYDNRGRGWQNMYDILDQSLNTGTVFIANQLGPRLFRDYFERFGLSSNTGIDLPQEIAGNLRNLEDGGNVEYATASYGQGIAVTPLGLATALSSIANGGIIMQPYIVQSVIDDNGTIPTKPIMRRRVLKTESTEIISRMLSKVVDNTLAGGTVAMEGYHIAAKTGTAQIPDGESGGYSDQYLHTFFGYAPAFDPQFFILLFLEKPQGVRYASQTLANPFRELTEFIINYYEIPPDR